MKLYSLIFLLLLSNCRWFTRAELPFLSGASFKVPDGTPIFQEGFRNGCSTALAARATGFYRDKYKHTYNPQLIDNPEYKFGYGRGYSYCFQYTVAGGHTLLGSADAYIFGRGVPFDMGVASIDATVPGGGGAWSNPFGFATGGGIDDIWSVTQKGKGGGYGASHGKTAEGSNTVLTGHPLWGSWGTGQIFGQ